MIAERGVMTAAALARALDVIEDRATEHARSSTLHGPRHWRDVARCGLALRHVGVIADWLVVVLFAALHDSQRRDDGHDPRHGSRAADVARELRAAGVLVLGDAQARRLYEALERHPDGDTTDDLTVGACFDADRLTLWRVRKMPMLQFMSTVKRDGSDRWRDITRLSIHALQADDVSWQRIAAAALGDRNGGVVADRAQRTLWYHGTRAAHRASIEAQGLLAATSHEITYAWQTASQGVYLTPIHDIACSYAEWRVQALRLHWLKAFDERRREPGRLLRDYQAGRIDFDEFMARYNATGLTTVQQVSREHRRVLDAGLAERRLLVTIDLPDSALGVPDMTEIEGVAFPQRIPPEWFASLEEW